MGGGGKEDQEKEKGGFLNPKNSDLVFGKGGLLNPSKPKKPAVPVPPEIAKPEEKAADAALAANKKKKQAIGAYGFSDTNLTGGKLGQPSAANLDYKTILGG